MLKLQKYKRETHQGKANLLEAMCNERKTQERENECAV
jgi:hypothetical protein